MDTPVVTDLVAEELRWISRRFAGAARSGQTSRSTAVRRMARRWAEQSRWFGLLAGQVEFGPDEPTPQDWSARLDSQPGRYVPDTVELSGPAVTELIRYVVEHLALVDGERFAAYAAAARAVEEANWDGVATDAQLQAVADARGELEVWLLGSLRLPVADAQRVSQLLADAVSPARVLREAA